jgi:uncharacterized protein
MRIAVIGGGASGMVTAYLLDKQHHQVTVFERQPILGGHIRTLNKNVKPNQSDCDRILESGVLEFPTAFTDFITLMQELEVELEPVNIGSGMFLQNATSWLSRVAIDNNFTGIRRSIEHLRTASVYARATGLWLRTQFANIGDFGDRPLCAYLQRPSPHNTWLKLLVMYSYSIPIELLDDFPAALAIPMLRAYLAVKWVGIKGGVYTYIEKILTRFKGEILLNVEIDRIVRQLNTVKIILRTGQIQEFDKVVFATPPDRVMTLLADPTPAETRRFAAWKPNYATSIIHQNAAMYDRYNITQPAEFDFFQTSKSWGYNGYLNQLCRVPAPPHYFLSFQLEELISSHKAGGDRGNPIVHIQQHHTPLYTTEAFRYRDETIASNGEHNTYHAGAYLGDGLHGGAISSAVRVARSIGVNLDPMSPIRRNRERVVLSSIASATEDRS